MQFFTALTVLAAAFATVGAAAVETNAQRMARGLPPKSPVRRGSPTLSTSSFAFAVVGSVLTRLI